MVVGLLLYRVSPGTLRTSPAPTVLKCKVLSITIWRKHGVRSLQPVCVGSNIALVNADPGRACH